ncbi:MAG: hypothetical protein L6W00_29955 [Lentisphaeria bacterium]|nr:MAG: hypothetical protein L6W00_29955 [Lentisphaeria bacterium]
METDRVGNLGEPVFQTEPVVVLPAERIRETAADHREENPRSARAVESIFTVEAKYSGGREWPKMLSGSFQLSNA